MEFKELGIIPNILKALEKENYVTPTSIQEQAIPAVLKGKDVLGCAQTGTGKTAAFAVPTLQLLDKTSNPSQKTRRIRSLILTPTRELAVQIQESFETYGKFLDLKSCVIFGGVSQVPQLKILKRGVDVLVATPGRLIDLVGQKLVDLSHVEIFILDEADRMLDMGFIRDVQRIIAQLPEKKQTLLFSATMPPEIADMVDSLLHKPVTISVTPVSSAVEVIDQTIYFVDKNNKGKLLLDILKDERMDSVLVFTRTKHGANKVVKDLVKKNIQAEAIHGNKSQNARQIALANFKSKKTRVLVATDIAARGIDIDELAYVINYDLPEVPETYVHRIGRTGRAGLEGTALSFCSFDERPLLASIEKLIKKKIKVSRDHNYPMIVTTEQPKKPQQKGGAKRSSSASKSGRGQNQANRSHPSKGMGKASGSKNSSRRMNTKSTNRGR